MGIKYQFLQKVHLFVTTPCYTIFKTWLKDRLIQLDNVNKKTMKDCWEIKLQY